MTVLNQDKAPEADVRSDERFGEHFSVTPVQKSHRSRRTESRQPVESEFSDLSSSTRQHYNTFRFVDLFAGIGGFRRGFESIGGRCVYTCEWNRFAVETYRANFVCNHEIGGDITKIDASKIPSHDVLLAGFPCQPFSIAGVSKKNALNLPHGFQCEQQGSLFFELVRILEAHRPYAFLLENVKNLCSHDKGRTFKIIHHVLTKSLGYHVQWRILDAREWVPQHRERIFIAGFRELNGFTFEDLKQEDLSEGPRLKTILHTENGSEVAEPPYTLGPQAHVSPKYTLSDHLWSYLQHYAARHKKAGNGFGYGLVEHGDVARTLSARYFKDGSEILVKQTKKNPRRLTPRECARLMGFDRPREERFVIPVSDAQAYRQFGNAVVVPCAERIAAHMARWLPYRKNASREVLSA